MRVDYKAADKTIVFNDDPDLEPIEVILPKPPPRKEIVGYGLPHKEQKFKRPFIPKKLFELEKNKNISMFEKADILKSDPEYWAEEIEFIQQEWDRRINGVWYYINGKPTYITGVYYFYLTAWFLERGYPDYRDRDRKFWIFAEFCENDKDCYGFVYPKHRREGATTKAACWNYEYVSRRKRVRGGIQSMTDKHGELVFQKHLVPGWRKLPFWFRPVFEGSTNPKAELSFNAPALRITRSNLGTDEMEDLESSIDFMSSTEGAYDGSRLERYHGDEVGKCLVKDTECRMYDGSVKKVQDITPEDILIGPDSKKRKITSIARGREVCYDIIPNQGESWGCNESHILSLKVADKRGFRGVSKGGVLNISVKEYLNLSNRAKKHLVLYKTGVEYKEKKLNIDPYILGAWIGDGTSTDTSITTVDNEILNEWTKYSKELGHKIVVAGSITHRISSGKHFKKGANIMLNYLKEYNLIKNKHIPNDYLINSSKNRLQLLAGIIDTDGHLTKKNDKPSNYEIIQKKKIISLGIKELALSLGFNATLNKKIARMKRDDGSVYKCDVYRVNIYGDLYRVPCKVKHKIAKKFKYHKNRRNPLHTGFKVKKRGYEDYYGFTLKEDPLFLLKDYTVTHNTTSTNVYKRHLVVRQCLTELNKIIGKAIYTSTAGEMEKKGGAQFKQLIEASNYHKRDDNGRTTSGLYTLFISALEGFIVDEFGNSVIEDPTTITYDMDGKLIKVGAKNFLLNVRKQALEDEDYDTLNESTRQFPIRLRDCFRNAGDGDNFNMAIIQSQLDKYQFGNNDITVGDFEWENGVQDGRVIFVPKENGKFKISWLYQNPEESNRYYNDDGLKIPANHRRFIGGADTFKFKNTQGGKKSDGGGAVFMRRDHSIDNDDRPIAEWETHRFICTYLYRPRDIDVYSEDMLMMCIYYGCRMAPEINISAVMDHFNRRGYQGYLHYVMDKRTGKYKKNPGYNTNVAEREAIFRLFHALIENHGHRMNHDDLLEQLRDIDEDMGDYDLFAAGGMALMADEDENNFYYGDRDNEEEGDKIDDFFRTRKY